MDDTANPQGSESPASDDIEAAFEQYLERQANPAADAGGSEQPAAGAGDGQPTTEAKPDAAGEQPAEEQRFKVKVAGEEREVPLSELLKGYQLESDYRIKTSQVAEQARAAQAQFAQAQALQQRYSQALQTQMQQLAAVQPQPPDPAMIESDPVSYLRQQQAYQGWQDQVRRVQDEAAQLQAAQAAQEQQHTAQIEREQAELLLKAIPDWSDAAKARAEKAEVAKFLKAAGYTDAEIQGVRDHRAVVMARKAMLYDQLQAKQQQQQQQATQKVQNLPPKPPQRPGGGDVSPTDGRTRSMQSLKKTGSIEDAAQVFASMLGAR